MNDAIRDTLAGWGNFYLITGTAAATLTGLQFVVQTLIASESLQVGGEAEAEAGIAAFGTPTVVHFGLALLVSGVLCAPWPSYPGLRMTLALLAAGALGYSAVVFRRALRQRTYVPGAEDWIWHLALPIVSYVSVLVAAVGLGSGAYGPLFAVAAATLLLLCIGIHNAWDTVTYLTVAALRSDRPVGGPAPAQKPAKPQRRHRRQ